jgi:hypothetical protein
MVCVRCIVRLVARLYLGPPPTSGVIPPPAQKEINNENQRHASREPCGPHGGGDAALARVPARQPGPRDHERRDGSPEADGPIPVLAESLVHAKRTPLAAGAPPLVASDHSHGLFRVKTWGAARDRRVPHGTRGDAGANASGREVEHMDLTTIVIVLLVVAVLGGGGWGYSRWRG